MSLSVPDYTLHRRMRRDVERHNQRLKKAMRESLPEVMSREDIITSDGQKTIKIPIRSLELPRFRFDHKRQNHVGTGNENTRGGNSGTQPGTVIGHESDERGDEKKAGDKPGQDYYEAEITIDELVDLAFEELNLPNLDDKGKKQLKVSTIEFNTLRKTGPQSNIDTKRTLIEAYKRNAASGRQSWDIDPLQDPRYKSWEEVVLPERNAVIFAMRDVSGSMGEEEAYICRTFYTWMLRFLRKCYDGVEIVFITCHTEAQEVDEDTFFHLGGSGGTRLSSAYNLCLDTIRERYDPSIWNIYPFLFSDGYDWLEEECVAAVRKLLPVSNLVGYGEITSYGYWDDHDYQTTPTYWAPLGKIYQKEFSNERRFVAALLKTPKDVWPALREFMKQRHKELAA